jgi:hypothetical protein
VFEEAWPLVDTVVLKAPLFPRIGAFRHNVNTSSLQTPAMVNNLLSKDVVQSVPAINGQVLAVNPTGVNLKTLPRVVWEQVNMLLQHHMVVNLHIATSALVDPLEAHFQDSRRECPVD